LPPVADPPAVPRPLDPVDRTDEALVRRHLAGDAHAREELVRRLEPLVDRLARRYRGFPHRDDLRQVAFLGLAKAIDRFDPDLGIPLRGYAVPTILGELRRHLRDHGWAVRPPRGLQELSLDVTRCAERLLQATGHQPTPGDIARELDLEEEVVVEALVASRAHQAVSLDQPVRSDGDGDATLGDTLPCAEPGYERVDDAELVSGLPDVLSREDWMVLRLRFMDGRTQEEVAERLGVSQMTISRRQRAALERLRRHLAA
jgi:RNA polymerase sigma-B factor